jgi:short-subunit dehydrogenase
VPGDVSDAVTRDAAVKTAREQLGGLDMLINNAGTSAHGRFEDASPERLRRIMEVNFFAAAELTRAALPLLREGREPVVVNVGSILGRRGVPFNSEYCASKFALVGWSEAVRPELARQGIDVLVVNPGTTDTEFFAHLIEKTGEVPWKTPKGVPASTVARATIDAIRRRKSEIVVGNRGRFLVWLNRLAPRWVDRRLRRYG